MSDSSSDEHVVAAPVNRKPPVVDSDSSEDEVAPASKKGAPSTPVRAAAKNSDRDDSEDKVPKKAAAKEQPTTAKVVAKTAADSDDSDDESAPARPAKAAAQDSSSEEEVAAKPKAKAAVAPAAVAQDSDSSSEEVVSAKTKVAAAAQDSDSDSEAAPKAPVALANDSDDSDDSDKPAAQATKAKGEQKKAKLDAAVQEPKPSATASSKQKGDDETDELRVIIKGLPFTETNSGVRKVFSSCGHIKHVKMLTNENGTFNGVCFINFATADGAKAALKKDGDRKQYKGLSLSVARANKTIPQKGVDATKKKQNKATVLPDTNPGGLKTVITKDMYHTMVKLQEAKDFVSLEKLATKIAKTAKAAQQEIAGQHKGKEKRSGNTVFVRGLPMKDFDEEAFSKRFQDCGEFKFVWLPVKKDGTIKGFGTIGFKTEEAFNKALKYDGTKCKGEVLSVKKSEPVKLGTTEVAKGEADKAGAKRKTPPTEDVSSEVADKQAKKKHKQAPEAVADEAPRKDKSERKTKEHKEKPADEEVVHKKAKKDKK